MYLFFISVLFPHAFQQETEVHVIAGSQFVPSAEWLQATEQQSNTGIYYSWQSIYAFIGVAGCNHNRVRVRLSVSEVCVRWQ